MLTDHERAEYLRLSAEDAPRDSNPYWRLRWLYNILDREGKLVPFVPTEEQIEVIVAIHMRGWRRILIPKARQLGMSTVLVLIAFDMVLFNEGFSAALVDKRGDDAEKKMREKVLVAWDALEPEIKQRFREEERTTTRIGVRIDGDEAVSRYEVGVNFRGGTVQFLHVSEWGWIQANDPGRSKEILAGSLPAAERGIVVVETTWEGGKAGDVWPLVEEALAATPETSGPDTWRLLFFPWWSCPEYASPHGVEDTANSEYLDGKEQELTRELHHDFAFTRPQRRWYCGVARKLKRLVRQEYPTTLDECWHAPVAGSIYGEELDRLRALSRTGKTFEYLRDLPIFTSWDLGMSDYTSIWLVQPHGTELLWLDWHEAEGEPASYYAGIIQRWENAYKPITSHFLPHDADRREIGSGMSYVDTLAKLGVRNVIVVPQTPDIWWGIGQVRELLARSTFHAKCSVRRRTPEGAERMSGLECLEAYRRHTETGPSGALREAPVHDHASHAADSARTWAEGLLRGLVPTAKGWRRGANREERKLNPMSA
jgi:hypothetical protein